MAQHFSTNHGDHELPEDYALEKAEEERVKKLNFLILYVFCYVDFFSIYRDSMLIF